MILGLILLLIIGISMINTCKELIKRQYYQIQICNIILLACQTIIFSLVLVTLVLK